MEQLRRIESDDYWIEALERANDDESDPDLDGEILRQAKLSKTRAIHEASIFTTNSEIYNYY